MTEESGYPRPLLRRGGWQSLDGRWEFALDRGVELRQPRQVTWTSAITVPFAPETPASGVQASGFFGACWYRRNFNAPLRPGHRLLLHFGAVDHGATVWVNGRHLAAHEGGYAPFTVDVTDELDESGPQTLVVRAEDDPHDLAKPRGKQDWQEEPHSIWYPRTSGIWQTVWLEAVPGARIDSLHWTPDIERWQIAVEAAIAGAREGQRLRVRLASAGRLLADDTYAVTGDVVSRRIGLRDPGVARDELLWSPSRPTLVDARLELLDERGESIDTVESYTAMRSVGVDHERFLLNARPYHLRMVLDQGYWPDTGLTPPDDAALRRDVELAKELGFNGVRKHQKIEDPRYLYWADRLGLLVWEEMPSAYAFDRKAVERLTREWTRVIDRDASHPCIVSWVPFNESWGVPDLPASPEQRAYVEAVYHLTKALDPTRPVIGNDGWESVTTDMIGVHDYEQDPARLRQRYTAADGLARMLERERPAGRRLLLAEHPPRPVVLSEFGGVAFANEARGSWGYSRAGTAKELAARFRELQDAVRSATGLAGSCYTQFTDTYQEANGLLSMDRRPKFPTEEIRAATTGR